MKVPLKLGVFAATLAVAFAAAFGVGSLVDPIASADRTVDLAAGDGTGADGGHGGAHAENEKADPAAEPAAPADGVGVVPAGLDVPGLAVSERGYTLELDDPTPGAGEDVEVAFTIRSPDGGSVLNYRPTHEKEMHLIVVRRDLTGFQHLHPERDSDGTWRVPADLSAAGVYRVFADFAPAALSETLTLGADLFVPGDFQPAEIPAPDPTWTGADYEVTLAGTPSAGAESELTFTVERAGSEVTDLEPYLGAFGHLVSLRSGDLAYLHTHPADEASGNEQGGPQISFGTTFPTAGLYRLYLNFAHEGSVRTAEFTVEVPEGAAAPAAPVTPPAADEPNAPAPTEPQTAGGGHSGH